VCSRLLESADVDDLAIQRRHTKIFSRLAWPSRKQHQCAEGLVAQVCILSLLSLFLSNFCLPRMMPDHFARSMAVFEGLVTFFATNDIEPAYIAPVSCLQHLCMPLSCSADLKSHCSPYRLCQPDGETRTGFSLL
jgi:hypothetical protein